jgi:hypothetical protein
VVDLFVGDVVKIKIEVDVLPGVVFKSDAFVLVVVELVVVGLLPLIVVLSVVLVVNVVMHDGHILSCNLDPSPA